MSGINYILSVSAKGILPDAESKLLNKLEQKFGQVQKIYGSPWRLSQEGIDEKIYRATMPGNHPLSLKEIQELKASFDAEKQILEVYRLEKI